MAKAGTTKDLSEKRLAKFHGGLQVMVWGIINKQGGVKLVWVNRMKNGALNSK